MRASHSVLAIGGLLCVLASIVAWIGIVVNDEFRTVRAVLFATGTLVVGTLCCAIQLTLYNRWKNDLH